MSRSWSSTLAFAVVAFQIFISGTLGQSPACNFTVPENDRCFEPYSKQTVSTVTGNLSQQDPCCARVLPPIKLVATGNTVINPQDAEGQAMFSSANCIPALDANFAPADCITPPAFYTQYTNAYIDNTTFGIPILSRGADEDSLLRVRRTTISLLRSISKVVPALSELFSRAYYRIILLSCQYINVTLQGDMPNTMASWSENPEINGLNRSYLYFPYQISIGVEEARIGNNKVPCDISSSVQTQPQAFDNLIRVIWAFLVLVDGQGASAISCLAAKWVEEEYYWPHDLTLRAIPMPANVADRFKRLGDLGVGLAALGRSYLAEKLEIWTGRPNYLNESRAIMKQNAPDLACLLSRYFPDVGELDGNTCHFYLRNDTQLCSKHPGSCYCGVLNMTAQYLGPPIDRTKCGTPEQIKKDIGFDREYPNPPSRFLTCLPSSSSTILPHIYVLLPSLFLIFVV